jgi:hypothetical protein
MYGTRNILLCKTLVLPMLYGAECWKLSRTDEKMADVFERRILQKVDGDTKDRVQWRCRLNRDPVTSLKSPDIQW